MTRPISEAAASGHDTQPWQCLEHAAVLLAGATQRCVSGKAGAVQFRVPGEAFLFSAGPGQDPGALEAAEGVPDRQAPAVLAPRLLDLMESRAQQRADTRDRIVEAALDAFAELGFGAASTREIARRAGANQGLITYHFRTKEELWRAAADRLFGMLHATLGERLRQFESDDPRAFAREAIREYVRFSAAHPEFYRFMVDESKRSGERMRWLVDTHLKPLYEGFLQFGEAFRPAVNRSLIPHAYYVLAGAASLIFTVAPECRRLTGLRPETARAVSAHAEFVARLLVP